MNAVADAAFLTASVVLLLKAAWNLELARHTAVQLRRPAPLQHHRSLGLPVDTLAVAIVVSIGLSGTRSLVWLGTFADCLVLCAVAASSFLPLALVLWLHRRHHRRPETS